MITLLFWPFMILSIILSLLGVSLKKPILLYIASVLIVPISLYIAFTPIFFIWGLIFPCLYIASAQFIKKGKIRTALLLNLPIYLLIGAIGFVVLNQ